jgi:hypothetical protein
MADRDGDGAVRTELDVVMAEIKGVQDFVDTKIAEGLAPMREEMTRMSESVSEAEKQLKDARRAQVSRMDTQGQLKVREGRFAGLGLPELSIIRAGNGNFRMGGQTLAPDHRIFTEAAEASKSLAESLTIDHVDAWVEHAIKARALAGTRSDLRGCTALDGCEPRHSDSAFADSGGDADTALRLAHAAWRHELVSDH